MQKGYEASVKELRDAGVDSRTLCPICFENEIESDLNVKIQLNDPRTVQFFGKCEHRYCVQCTIRVFKQMLDTCCGVIDTPLLCFHGDCPSKFDENQL